MSAPKFHIHPVRSALDLSDARHLFEAYAESLGFDLAFQGFAEELDTLPGKYAAPAGALLLARHTDGTALGCVALRPMRQAGCCEMKRLYVSPQGRGLGLGKALVDAILGEAVRIGYEEMRLDTLPAMTQAIALYRKAGFEEIAPYYDTPLSGTLFLGKRLRAEKNGL